MSNPRPSAIVPEITETEAEITILVAHGLSNTQIASTRKSTKPAIERHIQRIFKKLGFRSRVELAIYAFKVGLVKLEHINLDERRRRRKEQRY